MFFIKDGLIFSSKKTLKVRGVKLSLRQRGIEPRSTAWKATMLTITPLTLLVFFSWKIWINLREVITKVHHLSILLFTEAFNCHFQSFAYWCNCKNILTILKFYWHYSISGKIWIKLILPIKQVIINQSSEELETEKSTIFKKNQFNCKNIMGQKEWLIWCIRASLVSLHNAQIFRLLLKISVQRNNFENLLFLTAHHQWANQSYLTAKLGREFLREFFFWFVRGEKLKLLGSSSCQLEVVACLCNSATWELVVVDNLRLGALHHSYLCW